ncbi:MAG: PD40 domain-containing protein [Chloroflexi bacterium]|nr:PD40 domain-containing protein [Chloroflexota bacterium]
MLVRGFRLTDKLSNAFLKLAVWLVSGFMQQVTDLREAGQTTMVNLYQSVTGATEVVMRGGRKAYDATGTRQRGLMVQRATMVAVDRESKVTVVEDPLVTQNRTLSVFAVVLMISLIAVVIWSTSRNNDNGNIGNSRVFVPLPQQTGNATVVLLPSATPTLTPVPQPLNWRGTLVFSVRENGQDDIFALQRGSSQPLRLTDHLSDDRDPAWSPDGRTVAFVSRRDGPWDLYTLDVITKQVTRLTFTPGFEGSPSFSPDGAFIAYESYQDNDLNIYIVAVDGSGGCPCRVTNNPGPDYEPDWMPNVDGKGGRWIAYTSWRGGQQDIYAISLDNPSDQAAINVTNTRDIDESYAAWSPDGRAIAYSGVFDGIEGSFYRQIQWAQDFSGGTPGPEVSIGRGRMPAWNPIDGSSLFYVAPRRSNYWQILAAQTGSFGGGGDLTLINGEVSDLDWTPYEPQFTGLTATYPPLYTEREERGSDGLYGLASLPGVTTTDAFLNTRVDDSFNALRVKIYEVAGWDVLAQLDDAFWRNSRRPEPGQDPYNWHYAGRAFSMQRNLISQGNPTPIVVVREDREVGTFWRVYVRVDDKYQNGVLGEPLRSVPWDFDSRTSGDIDAYENGGKLMDAVPTGYYVDFTELAADYGWLPIEAGRTWRRNFADILFWDFVKTDDIVWQTAMGELYTQSEVEQFINFLNGGPSVEPTAIPAATEVVADTPEPERSPTPLPPDAQ